MSQLFFQSVRLHAVWWLRSWIPGSHPNAPLSSRRILFLLIGFPLFFALQILHWICLGLDNVLFPAFRNTPIRDPVFIIGVPRSGTTFLHRTLAQDPEQFSTVPTWEAILAPSILEKRALLAIGHLDRKLGNPGRRILNRLSTGSRQSMDAIHPTGLDEPEEDYLWLLPAGGALIGLLAFPFSHHLRELASFDRLPRRDRDRWIRFHQDCVRRHLFTRGPSRRFLSKNAAFPSWIGDLADACPGAAFVLTTRDPAKTIRSQIRSLEPARHLFGTDPEGRWTAETFAAVITDAYTSIERALPGLERSIPLRTAVVDQEDLAAHGRSVIPKIIERIGARTSPSLEAEIAALRPHEAHPDSDRTTDPALASFEVSARATYEKILASTSRILPNYLSS